MEKSIIVTMATAVVLVFTSQFSTAGSITDTYTAGDTLTTTTLDNIKSAVNDNNAASRFYGDGSAGPLIVSADVDWVSTPPTGDNLNFTDFTIGAGSELTVPAGTTIRCTGTFTNNGTITVGKAINGGTYFAFPTSYSLILPPGRGDAYRAAEIPEGHTTLGVSLVRGAGGVGIPRTVAASSFNNFTIGGGGGAGTASSISDSGGGLVKIYCRGGIINNGAINANGAGLINPLAAVRGGGGGGGIIILASSTSIDNAAGSITANGGQGFNSSDDNGASGGGGGGIIVMIAPASINLGITSVTGGAGGTGGTTLTIPIHSAGGGGGASGGNGGDGGSISAGNVASNAVSGADGYVLEIIANPAHMM